MSFSIKPIGFTGLMAGEQRPNLFQYDHRHDALELNFVERGTLYYVRKHHIEVPTGHLALFWGAMPHQVVQVDKNAYFYWVTIPFAWFLDWDLPPLFVQDVLQGAFVMDEDAARYQADRTMFHQWVIDLKSKDEDARKTVLLELQARLMRLAKRRVQSLGKTSKKRLSTLEGPKSKVEQMATYIAGHYTEDLKVEEIAKAVDLHPNYAMGLFRKFFGRSLVDYLTQHRLSHAQRLLATTDKKIADVALEAGFGSLCRFYTVFTKECKQTPRRYRLSLRRT
jgi:AraC family transcriptional regulator, melibiose operon regulatory protein